MKKVLIISPFDYPIPCVLGGAVETLIESIIKENEVHCDFNFVVMSVFNKESKEKSKVYKNTKFIYYSSPFIANCFDCFLNLIIKKIFRKKIDGHLIKKFLINKYIIKHLKKEEYEFVVLENQGFLTYIYKNKIIQKKFKKKFIYHLHNIVSENVNLDFLKNENKLLISNYLKENIKNRFGENFANNSYILKNGINFDKFQKRFDIIERNKFRKEIGFDKNDFIICFFGRIIPEKGVIELLEAFEKVDISRKKLMIIGSAKFGKKAKSKFESVVAQKIKKLNTQIVLTGFIHNDELWKFLSISDVAVLPSIWDEPAGLTMLEALSASLPLITTNSGGIPEYLISTKSIIIDRNNDIVDNLALSINDVYSNQKKYKNNANENRSVILNDFSQNKFYINFYNIIKKIERKTKNEKKIIK